MYTCFKNGKIRKICETNDIAIRKIGPEQAEALAQRIGELRAANCLADMRKLPHVRLHMLVGNRDHQYAVDLIHPKRLIIWPITDSKVIDEKTIDEIEIIEIVDYHKK